MRTTHSCSPPNLTEKKQENKDGDASLVPKHPYILCTAVLTMYIFTLRPRGQAVITASSPSSWRWHPPPPSAVSAAPLAATSCFSWPWPREHPLAQRRAWQWRHLQAQVWKARRTERRAQGEGRTEGRRVWRQVGEGGWVWWRPGGA